MQNNDSTSVPVIILAGGQSQRLRLNGQYKWQLPFASDATLLQYIIDKISKQSKQILINAPYLKVGGNAENDPSHNLKRYSLPIIHDLLPDFQGPLAGLLTSLHWAKEQQHSWVATIACDTPFFPNDLLSKLFSGIQKQDSNKQALAITVSSGDRLHPIFGLWSTQLYDTLQHEITKPYTGSISRWARKHAQIMDIDLIQHDNQTIEPFLNINTLDDYQQALSIMNQLQSNKMT